MKKITHKYIRTFLMDRPFQGRGVAMVALVAILLTGLQVTGNQLKNIQNMKAKKALVERIPEMEKKIRTHTSVTGEGTSLSKINFNLEGVTIKEGIPYALIDGVAYGVGDTIGTYTVENILMEQGGRVDLKNKETQENKTLYVPLMK
jgi:hypothetical protein